MSLPDMQNYVETTLSQDLEPFGDEPSTNMGSMNVDAFKSLLPEEHRAAFATLSLLADKGKALPLGFVFDFGTDYVAAGTRIAFDEEGDDMAAEVFSLCRNQRDEVYLLLKDGRVVMLDSYGDLEHYGQFGSLDECFWTLVHCDEKAMSSFAFEEIAERLSRFQAGTGPRRYIDKQKARRQQPLEGLPDWHTELPGWGDFPTFEVIAGDLGYVPAFYEFPSLRLDALRTWSHVESNEIPNLEGLKGVLVDNTIDSDVAFSAGACIAVRHDLKAPVISVGSYNWVVVGGTIFADVLCMKSESAPVVARSVQPLSAERPMLYQRYRTHELPFATEYIDLNEAEKLLSLSVRGVMPLVFLVHHALSGESPFLASHEVMRKAIEKGDHQALGDALPPEWRDDDLYPWYEMETFAKVLDAMEEGNAFSLTGEALRKAIIRPAGTPVSDGSAAYC